jgi:hypothetical protein
MIGYGARVIGDNRAALRFDQFPELAHAGLRERMVEVTAELEGAVEALVPRGKTGAVASAIHSGTEDSNDRIRGWVSLAGAPAAVVKQAAALEYGSRGESFIVQSHHRTLDHIFSLFIQPMDIVVDEYSRTGGLAQLDYLHGPYHETAGSVLDSLNEAVEAAVRKTNDA